MSRIGATPVRRNVLLVPLEPIVVVQGLKVIIFRIAEFLCSLDEMVLGLFSTVRPFRNVDRPSIAMVLGFAKAVIGLQLECRRLCISSIEFKSQEP